MTRPWDTDHNTLGADYLQSFPDDLALWSAPFGRRLLDLVHYKRNIRVLDIGCGHGFPLIELAMRLGATSSATGIDPWEEGLHEAARRISSRRASNINLASARAESLPFKDSSFDLIVSNNGINNVESPAAAIAEISRVLKKGGQFAFTFNTDRTFDRFYAAFRNALDEAGLTETKEDLNRHIFTKRKPVGFFVEILEANGLRTVSINRDIFEYKFTDGTSMFRHSFIRSAFLPSWQELVPVHQRELVFGRIEKELNSAAEESGSLNLQVPFLVLTCEKS